MDEILRALYILKKKRVNLNRFLKCVPSGNVYNYNKWIIGRKRNLSRADFKFLIKVIL